MADDASAKFSLLALTPCGEEAAAGEAADPTTALCRCRCCSLMSDAHAKLSPEGSSLVAGTGAVVGDAANSSNDSFSALMAWFRKKMDKK